MNLKLKCVVFTFLFFFIIISRFCLLFGETKQNTYFICVDLGVTRGERKRNIKMMIENIQDNLIAVKETKELFHAIKKQEKKETKKTQ